MILRKMKSDVVTGLLITLLLAFVTGYTYAGDIDKGRKLYAKFCVTCHGADGVNVMPDAPNFAYSERLLRPDTFILTSIKQGKNAMPAYQGMLKDEDIMDVIAFLRTLENGGPLRP
jgi:cytochrome c6